MPMTDEITSEMIGLVFKGSSVTSPMLKSAMRDLLHGASGTLEKMAYTGKRSIKSYKDKGNEVTEIKISKDNISDFDHVARKYGVKYNVQEIKDPKGNEDKNRVLVVFKAKDMKTMTKAFKEYAGYELDKDGKEVIKETKSVDEKIQDAKEKSQERSGKDRERSRSQDISTTMR